MRRSQRFASKHVDVFHYESEVVLLRDFFSCPSLLGHQAGLS
jgi:hypothetical protein